MYLSELIKKLQDAQEEHGDIPVEFALHSYTQVHPTVYLRITPIIEKAWDGVARVTLHTGKDVRISILNSKVVALVRD